MKCKYICLPNYHITPPTHLTLLAAIPLVAAAGAHELRFALLAALALLRAAVVQAAGRAALKVLLLLLQMVIVIGGVLHCAAIAALIDDQPIGAIVRFVILLDLGRAFGFRNRSHIQRIWSIYILTKDLLRFTCCWCC